ncbi:MAG TPA: triple tyrosine motif-containing protein, partial [Bacteroidia bacterium]|nr:triple tyrosine motif-containing protein [Bacteroidia bacterium]
MAAQESGYLIHNYSPKDYNGFNQVWCGVQDRLGILHFGTSGSIISFNGQSWEKTPVRSGVAVRSMVIDTTSNIIYVGTVGDFGFMSTGPDGRMKFISLLDKIPEADRVFADVWRTFLWKGGIVFQTEKSIFIYRNGKFTVIRARTSFALSFCVDGRLFIKHREIGLSEVQGDSLHLLPGGELFSSLPLTGILKWNDGMKILLTGEEGIYTMDERNPRNYFSPRPVSTDSFLLNAGILGGRWMGDSVLCVNSRTGIAFYNRNLRLKEQLTVRDGLAEQSVADAFTDKENNLWLCTMNGITCISYGAPDRYYGKAAGFDGVFNCACSLNGILYIGTNTGIYREVPSGIPGKRSFRLVRMRKTEVWRMRVVGNDLLAATSEGLLQVKDDKVIYLTNAYANDISAYGSTEILVAEKNGLHYLKKDAAGNWQQQRYFEYDSREFINTSDLADVPGKPGEREVWATTRMKEICRIRFDASDSLISMRTFVPDSNFICPYNIFPFNWGDSVYFWGEYMALRYIPHLDDGGKGLCFGLADDLYNFHFPPASPGKNTETDVTGLFTSLPGSHTMRVAWQAGNEMRSYITYISDAVGDDISSVYPAGNGELWFCGTDAMICYNTKTPVSSSASFTALISRAIIGDSARYTGPGADQLSCTDKIPFRNNRFVFAFAAPFYNHGQETEFSYQLSGYDTSWSEWTGKTEIQYNNLGEGDYVFRVKARNIFGDVSRVAEYHFTILAPWYRTTWAYSLYVLSFAGLFFGSVRLSARRLRKQKEKLEKIVGERTAEVVQQKQQIEIQKSELETAYTDIQDSIRYAERIQQAILPQQSEFSKYLRDSFVLFHPRDIVSGDFYWFAHRDGKSFIACVDCTGHGVPGAFMSMIGNTMLNQIVLEKKIDDPAMILQALHENVRQALKQNT